ncbi:MAG: hypothetical protein OHK0013_27530 [Sandaracinaceae bacterium]
MALVYGLDRARLGWLRLLGPLATPFVRSRELRAATALTLSITVALVLTALAPLELLALGPLVLGVPHLAADVRYLVVRPGLHRRPAFWLAVGVPLVALALTARSAYGFLAVLGAAVALPARWTARRALVATVAGGLALASFHAPHALSPVVAHVHNLVAVAFFVAWPHLVGRARSQRWHLLPLALFVVASFAIFAGALDPIARTVGAIETSEGLGIPLGVHLATLSPAWLDAGPTIALRFVLFFAFAQSVHYGVWLRTVPEEDRARPTPRTFRASIEAMREDGSLAPVALSGLLTLALMAWAALDLYAARFGYLRGALFHGYLELAVAAALVSAPRARLEALASA